ncbi:hypothetical protein B0H14DRAFT_3594661 [Mycena olivaceomarginata]|nr:hypothetical protein B0H14DRAFT_3594661 [Mycena olivaceomarginata]
MNTSPSSSNTSPSSSNTSPSSSNTSPPSSDTSPPFSNTSPPSSNTARYLTAILEYPGAVFEYLAVVLEYLSTGLSELPGNAPRNIKKHPVVPLPFQLAIRNDDEEFGNGLGWSLYCQFGRGKWSRFTSKSEVLVDSCQ